MLLFLLFSIKNMWEVSSLREYLKSMKYVQLMQEIALRIIQAAVFLVNLVHVAKTSRVP